GEDERERPLERLPEGEARPPVSESDPRSDGVAEPEEDEREPRDPERRERDRRERRDEEPRARRESVPLLLADDRGEVAQHALVPARDEEAEDVEPSQHHG